MRYPVMAIAAVLLVSAGALQGRAAEPAEPAARSQGIGVIIPFMCPGLVQKLSGDQPQFSMALGGTPLDVQTVCGCASERFMKDREVSRVAPLSREELQRQRPVMPLINSYAAMRAIQHIMGCISEELDRRLAEVTLPLVEAPAQ